MADENVKTAETAEKAGMDGTVKKVIRYAVALVLFLIVTNPSILFFLPEGARENLRNTWSQIFGNVDSIKDAVRIDFVAIFKIIAIVLMLLLLVNIIRLILGRIKPKTGKGQFGGNGRNALSRIRGKISLPFPVFSEFNCKSRIFSCDANTLVQAPALYEKVYTTDGLFDLAYFDPPYNQHPYGSNYFMLNLIADYQRPDADNISRVSGIPRDWNRSDYNKKRKVAEVFVELVRNVRARYVLVSFNSEGFIPKDEMIDLLSSCGKVEVLEADYNAFRGSRNLSGREIHVKEFLFLVEKSK